MIAAALWLLAAPVSAQPTAATDAQHPGGVEQQLGRVHVRASGKAWGDVQHGRAAVTVRRIANTPWFVQLEGRADHETRSPYDLTHWEGRFGLGWALNETTDVLATYRLGRYKVFNTGNAVDPAFRRVAGHSEVAALGLTWRHDTRDDVLYPTRGIHSTQTGELAIKGLGGDYSFSRLESDLAYYATPFRERAAGSWWADVTFVEHLQVGWLKPFGHTDEVPFFERYFTGGSSTVRGSRNRWLSPRGIDQEFVGGQVQLVNNMEVRLPIFPSFFKRNLSVAAFADAGRSFPHWTDVGDFGYSVGGGLRYAVRLGPIAGVARADYGIMLDHEGDNTVSHVHLTFGMPF